MTPCLWCAHCVLHWTRTIVFNQNDDIDSVCAMFCANWACWSAPCFVVCPLCFAPEGLTLRKWVDFTLKWCAHAVGWLHAGWVDLTPAPSSSYYSLRLPHGFWFLGIGGGAKDCFTPLNSFNLLIFVDPLWWVFCTGRLTCETWVLRSQQTHFGRSAPSC